MIDDAELRLATEHPRGTERRRLLPYRAALQDPAVYATLPVADRDVIVRWAEIRRRIAGNGVDNDPANLADPLLPAGILRAHVVSGERIAAGRASFDDPGGDLIEVVRALRTRPPGKPAQR
ncbi:MAG: hypothetical protein HY071_02770 [Chloroflexi bacterium]|nr:hypothetical protein [Chloroflexota bacterium]